MDSQVRYEQLSTAAPPGRSRFYRPELDALRFIAFLLVYLTHTIPVVPGSSRWVKALSNTCGFGVPVFFALSAYLITELLTIEKSRSGKVDLRSFYVRRCLRIWPLYLLVLFVGFAVSRSHSAWAIPLSALMAYVLLVGNWYASLHDYLPLGIGPLWSIPVEEQFYLLWPVLVRRLARRNLGLICCAGWVCSQAILVALCKRHALIEPTIWTNSFVHLQYFALGAGLSLYLNGRIPEIRRGLRFLMIGGGFLLLFILDVALNQNRADDASSLAHSYPEFLFAGVAITLLLAGFLGYRGFRDWKVLRYPGKISYGLYVYHLPCLLLLKKAAPHLLGHDSPLFVFVVGLPMTMAIAAVSYRYFESPFLRIKERFAVVQSRAV